MQRASVRWLLAASLIVVTSSTTMAQQGGGRGRGGFGGFGGGFGLGGLVAMPEVQKELGLSEADAKKITDDLATLRPERTGGGGGNFRNLSQEERQKRFEEMRKQGEETAKKTEEKLKSSLTAAQFKRLNELRLQREGATALERTDVAEKLKLTTEQQAKIKTIAEEGRPRFGQGGGNAGGERPTPEEMRARREKRNTDLLAVLTPEQKTAWDGMQGAKFTFPERAPGGRGGRGNRPAAE